MLSLRYLDRIKADAALVAAGHGELASLAVKAGVAAADPLADRGRLDVAERGSLVGGDVTVRAGRDRAHRHLRTRKKAPAGRLGA
jgi:hypothetical protein